MLSPTTTTPVSYTGTIVFESTINPQAVLNYNPTVVPPTLSAPTPFLTSQISNNVNYIAASQAIDMSVFGLKPQTIHTITINNIDVTSMAKADGEILGGGLMTDQNGQINIKQYLTSSTNISSPIQQAAAAVQQLAQAVEVKIQSSDGTSVAKAVLSPPGYTSNTESAPINSLTKQLFG